MLSEAQYDKRENKPDSLRLTSIPYNRAAAKLERYPWELPHIMYSPRMWEVASRAHMRELSTSRGDVQSIGSSQLDALSNTTMSRSHPAPGQPSGLNSAAYAAASSGGGAPPPFCCECAATQNRCSTDMCPCFASRRMCDEHCESARCKCTGDCTNGPAKFHVPKHVQSCFLEHKNESSGLIVTLIGNDYIYRGDFYHESKNEPHVEEQLVAAIYDLISKYKVELYEIIIFVSKSPCFHQDCDPKCEVVDECKSNKACAKLLGLLLSKVRKELSKVDVRMSVKFLYPHLNRGDLYTKQGILSMLQAGIKVEPLLMKDWSAVMDWSPNADHKGEYLQLWNSHNLDKCNAQSQSFINECRRALGLSMKFWVAEIHEIVKNTILHYSEIRSKCNELNDALKQLDLTATPHKIRSTPSKRRSFTGMLELKDKLLHRGQSDKNKNGSNVSVASEEAHAQAMVASFCGRSFDDGETNEIAQRIRRATANINVEIEALLEFLTHKGAIG
uniref:APOBEC_N domain-containing protein n=1 Tax=Bursaphelenchus xylophilus TaxID=6326 RepID=A0A1I7RQP8_BURXY